MCATERASAVGRSDRGIEGMAIFAQGCEGRYSGDGEDGSFGMKIPKEIRVGILAMIDAA